ncbi:hypothetical protein [Corynebacterium sp.]|uniref:hypothetical protein n=1 Tax=Corynebacterium sp. TaxID=1720 RepID=UPI0025C1FA41|nr:hypothetical protein [Corynebacterium sp.]
MELNWAQQAIPIEVTELPSTGWSSEAVITLVISGVAIVLSAFALVWQVVSWRRSGPRITVQADSGISIGPMGTFEILTFTVSNEGRASTQVRTVDFVRSDGEGMIAIFPEAFLDKKPPLDLQPGFQETLVLRLDAIAKTLSEKGISPQSLVPRARSGHGDVTGKSTPLLVKQLEKLVGDTK